MEDVAATTNSRDQDERIRARRERIEKRSISRVDEGKNKSALDSEENLRSRRKQQVANSLVQLDKKKSTTIERVTSIRVEADHEENGRRINEEDKRQRRLQSLQTEALASGKKNAAVEMRWAELMEYNMPLELNAEVVAQKQACTDIIKSKDNLIKNFQRELKVKDEEYVKSLKKQGDNVEQLLARMSSQYKELQSQYESELQSIESAFLQERNELIESNRGDIDSLFEKRRVMEMNFMEARQEREQKHQTELNELRVRDAEDYNQLKIKLETDIQTLEQQLEEMRATYQMNTEKLEYNYRVLTERDMENSATLGQQKRKLTRLKDALSSLTTKYQNTDTKYKQENMELTEEYRRITKQYEDLQSKFRHFEIADNKKYRSIWEMHQEEVLESVHSLLNADKIIQQQQLGHRWEPPNPELLVCHSGTFATQAPASPKAEEKDSSSNEKIAVASIKSDSDNKTSASEENAEQGRSEVLKAKIKMMLKLLCAEASFLIDPKTREAAENMDEEQAAVAYADAVLKALNVETEAEVLTLVTFFFEKVEDDEEDSFALERATDEASINKSLGLKVTPDEVVQVIRRFVCERNTDAEELGNPTNSKRKSKKDNSMDEEQRVSDARRERDRIEEIEFWGRLADIVPDRSMRVWDSLEQALVKYNKLLEERAGSINEVASLKSQNAELKSLLNQYLGSELVQSLLIPPLQTTAVYGPDSPLGDAPP